MHGQSCVTLIAVGSCQIELPNCEIILREDQGPSHIEHLFLGYLDKWPRKWPGIGRALANPVPISQSSANRPIRCQSYAITEAICPHNLGTSALYGMVPGLLGG